MQTGAKSTQVLLVHPWDKAQPAGGKAPQGRDLLTWENGNYHQKGSKTEVILGVEKVKHPKVLRLTGWFSLTLRDEEVGMDKKDLERWENASPVPGDDPDPSGVPEFSISSAAWRGWGHL